MTFYDVRLPEDIERGATGGPGFKTTVLTISSGAEKRNKDWSRQRGTWNIAYGITVKSELQDVINHFYVMQGKANGFRFKDWSDFQIGDTTSGDASTKQSIGTGDGSNALFQVFKRYSISIAHFDRLIFKPVQGSLRVFLAGSEITVSEGVAYTVNYNSGLITFLGGHIPAGSADVSIMCEFDVPVRFDTDSLQLNMTVFSEEAIVELPQINIFETRDID